ncbi:LysR family transcriptional regulator [Fodinicola acaciae]|uniref:LysR family transcriptional regulator n=1 Tax=Fodinicola acaciae TaxID=2681555 RepID=UPI0013D8714E|nr:LysR family transcriptional regulator [Fodinicola acaciae]
MDLEVRELRYFQAVAEELNFSRAADRLGMAQPPLSRAIRQLERRIGAQLFQRDTRSVTLTAAGAVLHDEAGRVFDALSAATMRTRRAVGTRSVVVTAKPLVATDLLRRLAERFGNLRVRISGFGEQGRWVRDGRADLAIVGLPGDRRGLDIEELVTVPRVAALPATHPLAASEKLSRAELDGLPAPRCLDVDPEERAYWEISDQGPIVSDGTQVLEAVALGQAVALLPASVADRNQRADIAYRPVVDACPYTVAIGWPAGSRDADLARIVRAAVELADEMGVGV